MTGATGSVVVTVPGSKSITNRALLCAALARGRTEARNILVADDSAAMVGALQALGVAVEVDEARAVAVVDGCGGAFPAGEAAVDARSSGTTARFLLPVLAAMPGRWTLDGSPQLRGRPMTDLVAALRHAGASIAGDGLPLSIEGGFDTPAGGDGVVRVRGDITSQFLSGLMLAGPLWPDGVTIECTTDVLVARPFVDMTAAVMSSFGANVEAGERHIVVGGGGYRAVAPGVYDVEPDASAASYFLAAAAITGCDVQVAGLVSPERSLQGDARFADVVASMGTPLRGIDVDLRDIPDMVPTLVAVALFAEGPTRIRGVGFVRGHESDRLAAAASEFGKLGARIEVTSDGLVVRPDVAALRGATVDSHDDHRMAMALAVVGLRVDGVVVEGASAVGKTFPGFWDALASLRASCK